MTAWMVDKHSHRVVIINHMDTTIMGIFPHTKGYGYCLFRQDGTLLDFGSTVIRPVNNEKCLEHISSYLQSAKPHIIILRDDAEKGFKGSERIRTLLADIKRIAQDEGILVATYGRNDIRATFSIFGAKNKYEVALKLCVDLPVLQMKLPKERRLGYAEDYRMSMFDAVALVYTHLHFMN